MLSSSNIEDAFLEFNGKAPDDLINRIYNSSEVGTMDWKTFAEIVMKEESGIELYSVEQRLYNNVIRNYAEAVDEQLRKVQANDLVGLSRVISDLRKKSPTELIGICNERIDYHLNNKRTSGIANNSHRVIKDKLDHALNNKLSSAQELYRDRY